MSKVMFIKCSVKGCESKAFPIDLSLEDRPTKCPICDPDTHKKAKREMNEKKKIDNSGRKLDAGRVISLEEGMNSGQGVQEHNHNMSLDGEGVEVDTDLSNVGQGNNLPSGMEIPTISAAEAEAQAVAKLTPGQKAARTRKINIAKNANK